MKSVNWRLVGILSGATLLRCLFIQSRGIQYDDAFSIFLSQGKLSQIVSGTAADTMPPLYYFLLHFWYLVSSELWWLRLLSVMLSLISVGLIYQIVQSLAGESAAFFAGGLAAISPLQIYHAQDLRMYALTTCLVMGYFFFFLRLWQAEDKRRIGDWIGIILCSAGALYAHNLSGFLLLFPYGFLFFRKAWRWIFKLAMAHGVSLVLFIPWLIRVPGQVEKIQQSFWTPRPGVVEVIQAGMLGASNLPLGKNWLIPAAILSLGAICLVLIEVWRNRKKLGDMKLLIWCTGLPGFALFLISYLMRPLYVPRAFLAAYLALDGLAGWAIWLGWKKGGGKILLGLFILAAIVTLPYQLTFAGFPRSPYQAAMRDLAGEQQSGDVIIHDNKLSFFPAYFYAPNLLQKFIADEPGSANDTYAVASQAAIGLIPEVDLPNAVNGASRVVFVVFAQTITDYVELGLAEHPSLAWLDAHAQLEKVEEWNDLQAYFYLMEPGK
jgi:mannosyltransferase